jgi:ADP-ribose pyrophosphatase YjhB (NUDIX family)
VTEPQEPWRQFDACPRCGERSLERPADGANPFRCGRCGFVLYFNAASAVAALVVDAGGRMLFIRREQEPARGLLAMPGGFVDPGETAEEALRREVREEVGLEVRGIRYLASFANRYPYAGVIYFTLDLFFTCEADETAHPQALDAVTSVEWRDPSAVNPTEIAFDSMRAALRTYLQR